MKIICSSDWHADASTAGLDRFEDVERLVWDHVYATAVDERVGLFIFLGDLCDPDTRRSHRSIALAHEVAFDLHREGIESRWLVGNHDVVEDGSGTSTLSALAMVRDMGPSWPRVYEDPCVEQIRAERSSGSVTIVALPYPSRARAYDPIAFVEGLDMPGDGSILFAGHLSIAGIRPGSESGEMARGREVLWPIDAIRRRFGDRATCVGGHIHRAQEFDTIRVAGSLERLRFDEEEHSPGFLLIEI
jgi:DNA repair exonuclease SbcCD nuclease subunit